MKCFHTRKVEIWKSQLAQRRDTPDTASFFKFARFWSFGGGFFFLICRVPRSEDFVRNSRTKRPTSPSDPLPGPVRFYFALRCSIQCSSLVYWYYSLVFTSDIVHHCTDFSPPPPPPVSCLCCASPPPPTNPEFPTSPNRQYIFMLFYHALTQPRQIIISSTLLPKAPKPGNKYATTNYKLAVRRRICKLPGSWLVTRNPSAGCHLGGGYYL